MMMAGTRLIAPEGFHCLTKGEIYHFLHSDGSNNRVRLILFADDGHKIKSHLITLTRIEFEDALEAGMILEDGMDKIPPWLEPVAGVSVAEREAKRVSIKESYDLMVNRRFAAISDLVLRLGQILASDNPDASINAHAKAQTRKQNASRLRLWFYTYIVFGQNKWALMPLLHRRGGWDRDDPSYVRRLGRPSPNGKNWFFTESRETQKQERRFD
jgi:hypothetical protein